MTLNSFNQTITIAGTIKKLDPSKPSFAIQARSGDVFEAVVGSETQYSLLPNLDGLDRNRVPEPPVGSRHVSCGPHCGHALGCAWKRRSDGSSYSARQRAHISKLAIVVAARS